MQSSSRHLRTRHTQSGVVLITGLIFLVMLTLIVLAALRSGMLEERMASNARNRQIALQAAEAVLRDAEATAFAAPVAPFDPFTPASFSTGCTNGYCTKPDPTATPRWKTIDWTSTAVTRTFAAGPYIGTTLVPAQPRYIIELATAFVRPPRGVGCPTIVYKVTAHGLGQDSTDVYVQSMYRTQPASC